MDKYIHTREKCMYIYKPKKKVYSYYFENESLPLNFKRKYYNNGTVNLL